MVMCPLPLIRKTSKDTLVLWTVDKTSGAMDVAFQIQCPGVNFDLSHAGKGKSHGWFFFSCYNTEQANTLLWSKRLAEGQRLYHGRKLEESGEVTWKRAKAERLLSNMLTMCTMKLHMLLPTKYAIQVTVLDAKELKDLCYMIPCLNRLMDAMLILAENTS